MGRWTHEVRPVQHRALGDTMVPIALLRATRMNKLPAMSLTHHFRT